ncbi:MAG: holin [Oscillospiraceae bacterium]
MKKIFTKQWFKAAGIRSLKTVCQTAVATIDTSAVLSSVDWRVVLSASLLAGAVCP